MVMIECHCGKKCKGLRGLRAYRRFCHMCSVRLLTLLTLRQLTTDSRLLLELKVVAFLVDLYPLYLKIFGLYPPKSQVRYPTERQYVFEQI